MLNKKPVKRPSLIRGCESCTFKSGDFSTDEKDPNVIRCYCKARHVQVDAEIMSKDCDFYKISPDYEMPKANENLYGL